MGNTATVRETVCSKRQNAIWKNIKQCSGVSQELFPNMRLPSQVWYVEDIVEITNTAVILYNMMVLLQTGNVFENENSARGLSREQEEN